MNVKGSFGKKIKVESLLSHVMLERNVILDTQQAVFDGNRGQLLRYTNNLMKHL
jgi:hypothetical protein